MPSRLTNPVFRNDLNEVQKLIKKGVNVNEHSNAWCSPLMIAVLRGNSEIVGLLLKNGAKSDTCPSKHNMMVLSPVVTAHMEYYDNRVLYDPFYYAIKLNQKSMVQQFCDYGYNVNKKIGGTYFISSGQHLDLSGNMVGSKIAVNKFTYPIIAAAKFGQTDIFNFLLEKGVDIKVQDGDGLNSLMHGIAANKIEIINRLLQKGYPVNDTSSIGLTPIMYAAKLNANNIDIIKTLIKNGANFNYINSKGVTAFALACQNNRDLAYYLKENGAIISDSKTEFEINARMYHFLGDYYLAKGLLDSSKTFYLTSLKYFSDAIPKLRKEISIINSKKAGKFVAEVIFTVASSALVTVGTNNLQQSDMRNFQDIGMTRQQAYMATLHNYDYYSKIFNPFYEKNPIVNYIDEISSTSSLDEQKIFFKNKIKQIETSINIINGVLACIEKNLSGPELISCIERIQLPNLAPE